MPQMSKYSSSYLFQVEFSTVPGTCGTLAMDREILEV